MRRLRFDIIAVYGGSALIGIFLYGMLFKAMFSFLPIVEGFKAFVTYCDNMDTIQFITTAVALLLACKVLDLELKLRDIKKFAKRLKW